MKILLTLLVFGACASKPKFPLVELAAVDPTIKQDMRYHGSKNFIGRPIPGYGAPKCYLSSAAAKALKAVQDDLRQFGMTLKVFDCYRPVTAINDFIRWSEDPADLKMKKEFYPNEDKKDFWDKGYLTVKSSHARGSAVDVTIEDLKTGPIDMGTDHDFLDPLAAPAHPGYPLTVRANRALLHYVMEKHNFYPAQTEWWHFRLNHEPYPDTYFDELIK